MEPMPRIELFSSEVQGKKIVGFRYNGSPIYHVAICEDGVDIVFDFPTRSEAMEFGLFVSTFPEKVGN